MLAVLDAGDLWLGHADQLAEGGLCERMIAAVLEDGNPHGACENRPEPEVARLAVRGKKRFCCFRRRQKSLRGTIRHVANYSSSVIRSH